jgi:hypothetical protein
MHQFEITLGKKGYTRPKLKKMLEEKYEEHSVKEAKKDYVRRRSQMAPTIIV